MESARDSQALGVAYQIPRNTLALLMIAQVVVLVPFALEISPWIVGAGLFCGVWRTGVYQGRWDYPKRWVKALLVVGSLVGVALSGVGAFSLEAAASVLILAFALKLIEMKSRRDAYVVIFLGYFAIATQFLFDQSITLAAYEFAAICVVTAAMVIVLSSMNGVSQLVENIYKPFDLDITITPAEGKTLPMDSEPLAQLIAEPEGWAGSCGERASTSCPNCGTFGGERCRSWDRVPSGRCSSTSSARTFRATWSGTA